MLNSFIVVDDWVVVLAFEAITVMFTGIRNWAEWS